MINILRLLNYENNIFKNGNNREDRDNKNNNNDR